MKNHIFASLTLAFAASLAAITESAASSYSNAVMSLDPVAYWPLSETTTPPSASPPSASNLGTLGSLFDASFLGDVIYGYPGAIAGTTDSADSFNGFNDARESAPLSTSAYANSSSFTIEAWLKSHDDGTYWSTTCPLSDADATSPRSGWLIYANISNNGQYTFRTYATNGTTASLNLDLGAPHSINEEQWYHVVVVVSNAVTVTNVYGYIDGALVAGPVPLPAYVPNDGLNGGFSIGNRSDVGSGFTYVGAIDEVAYYTNALDPATILAHYETGTNPSPATAYSTLVQQLHPALYYRMDEAPVGQPYPVALPVAVNYGSLGADANGFYQPGTTPGVAGPTNSGFGPVSYACNFGSAQSGNQSGPGILCAPFHQDLLNFNHALTMTAWIRVPSTPSYFQTPIGRGDTSYRFSVANSTGQPHFAANPNGDLIGPASVADGAWHFWAGVIDPATAEGYLYIDGALVQKSLATPLANMTSFLLIGGAPDYTARNFFGDICQVAIFTNALSASQIGDLYSTAGTAPSVALLSTSFSADEGGTASLEAGVSGTPPLSLQWYSVDTSFNTNVIAGQTNTTLTLTNVQGSQDQYQYFLVASNVYGRVSSPTATLTVYQGLPVLQVDLTPSSQQVPIGATVTYNVSAVGTLPFTYKWYQDGSLVQGETNSTYSFAALSGSHTYSCTVSNGSGPANSAVVTVVGVGTAPPVVTFNTSGTGWTINGNVATAGIVNNVLTLTDGTNSEASSAFFNTLQYNAGFAAFFTYQEANGTAPLADGVTFCLQNSSAGVSAVGGGGGELGYTGISNSVAFEINIYNGAHGGIGIQFGTNGMTADSPIPTPPYFAPSPVNLASGDPINVQLYFSQGVYYLHLVDATTGDSYTTTYNLGGSMRSVIGADSAYVGFTGGTGGLNSIQKISNFRFSYTTPPVLSVVRSGGNVIISWPVSVATLFQLQQSANVTGPWTNVGTAPTIVGSQNQVTLPLSAAESAQFYRLNLQ